MPAAAQQFDVYKAFHDTVFAYPGGVDLLAAKMGKAAGVLYNKANLNDSSHNKPTLCEGVQVQVLTGDSRIVQAMAAVLGGVFVPVQQLLLVSDRELLEIISEWMAEQGRFFTEMNLALADGQVDKVEHAKLRCRAQSILAAVLELVARLEQMRK
jgi:hypothetical protein